MDFGNPVFSVTDITQIVKEVLERAFGRITVEGEISNFRPSSTGHWYFTLKDDRSALSAAMFKNRLYQVPFRPADGQKVRVTGSLSVYAQRGTYQIVCDTMTQVGTGDILEQLEQRKQALRAEGLFDQDRKRPIPRVPGHIAVITSPTGAALRDILHVLRRRNASAQISILPAPVQGQTAAEALAQMIELADRLHLADVIIIGRGGGSVEDLLPFSDERLVRAIARTTIPVISAVGHETDWALSDLVADLRAPTPSAAAELVTSEQQALAQTIRHYADTLREQMDSRISHQRLRLSTLCADALQESMSRITADRHLRINDLHDQITSSTERMLLRQRHRFELVSGQVISSSPKALLERGYALVIDEQSGRVITSAAQAAAGMKTTTIVHDGSFTSTITGA
ncbi:MAG: exodeoxyribonuclease VII large subunit [Spirochaetia bacterium]|nr:exodeoxyribonuclease VII large subunit [Spirochaetia bacterium]